MLRGAGRWYSSRQLCGDIRTDERVLFSRCVDLVLLDKHDAGYKVEERSRRLVRQERGVKRTAVAFLHSAGVLVIYKVIFSTRGVCKVVVRCQHHPNMWNAITHSFRDFSYGWTPEPTRVGKYF